FLLSFAISMLSPFHFSPIIRLSPNLTLFPYTTLFRSGQSVHGLVGHNHHIRRLLFFFPLSSHRITSLLTKSTVARPTAAHTTQRSEEHTSELQSRFDLVCRLLLEKKNKK